MTSYITHPRPLVFITSLLTFILLALPASNGAMNHHDYHNDVDKWSSTHHIHHPTMEPSIHRVREAAEGASETRYYAYRCSFREKI